MKSSPLTIASLLSILLFALHLSGDIVYGYEPGRLTNYPAVLMMVAGLYGTVVLAGRRSGLVIILFGSLLGAVMPLAHMRGAGLGGAVAKHGAGVFFIGTLLLLGAASLFTAILSAQGLWASRRGQAPQGVTEN
jgi:hypothetical protein